MEEEIDGQKTERQRVLDRKTIRYGGRKTEIQLENEIVTRLNRWAKRQTDGEYWTDRR